MCRMASRKACSSPAISASEQGELEDNLYLEKGRPAPSNAALVEKAARIIEVLGDTVANPAQAREILRPPSFRAA